ncbi:MAG: hypothetical protein PHY93_12865 [Bacteriovorax sp.]|nr:hypothetical protein [Bacteriovorax sp.]
MNNVNEKFYSWMKSKIAHTPPARLDQKILMMANNKLNHRKKSFRWMLPSGAFTASLVALISVSIYFNHHKNLNSLVLNEAPEMIFNYDKIELMADASSLSDDDWKKIEGTK